MITMKNVIREGNELLRKKSLDVNIPLSIEDQKIMNDMINYIYDSTKEENENNPLYRPAVGLAAPQLGILKKMIAIVAPDENGEYHEFFLINPKIKSYSDELTYLPGGEGCLSVDRECHALIHRPYKVTFEAYYYDKETSSITLKTTKLKGYLAIVFQHEYDHLNGILFVDRVNQKEPNYIPNNSHPIEFK